MISEEDLVAYCDAEQYGPDAADLLVDLETYVVAAVQQVLGIYLGDSASKTEYLDGGGFKVFVQQEPISVTSVSTRYGNGDTWSVLDSGDYIVTGRQIRKVDGVEFPPGEDAVRVIADLGYDGSDWQLPLRRLVLNTVNWYAKVGRKAEVEDVLKASDTIPGWNETIRMYKRPLYG